MAIIVDSVEYKCWHEVGHAAVCLHLGGDVTLIEFLAKGHGRGRARTRTDNVTTDHMHRTIACGGFAAEALLKYEGWSRKASIDTRDIDEIIWHNASGDREDFRGRMLSEDAPFTVQESHAFMEHAVAHALPVLYQHLPGMRAAVAELRPANRIEGRRLREILRPRPSK